MSRPLNKPREAPPPTAEAPAEPAETCDLCGSVSVEWRNCKLMCLSCRAIVRSCSDL